MFRLYHSNQLDVLKSILAHLLKTDPQSDPFVQEKILVQSPGMAQWLKIELAKELSICANIEFPLPASFIWQIFVDLLDDVPKRSAFNKDAMAWNIMQRLPLLLEREEFSELAQYLEDSDQLKIYQLSYKIADVYDQYLVYRPQWIEAWESGSVEFTQDQPWQSILWQDLMATIKGSGQSHYHRANLYQYLFDALASDTLDVSKLPQRIFVFGIAALPPRYMQALYAISKHCEVHFFLNNPCQAYWGDIVDQKWLAKLNKPSRKKLNTSSFSEEGMAPALIAASDPQALFDPCGELIVGNPLLASMGKLGRDNQYLLSEVDCTEVEAFVESEIDTLLGQINNDILRLDNPCFIAQTAEDLKHSHHKKLISGNDHSVALHSCHSPMREVEVLFDQLLAMFEASPELTPKDVVVMMPDVNAYSPYIQAVFGMASGRARIDFSISDRSAEQENPLLLSFLTLMKLPLLRHTSAELFALLEVPAIMAKFELTPQALDTLKLWIEDSGIRYGFEANTNNSWQFGLNRMFKGYSQLDDGDEQLWQNILAYPESTGLGAEQLGQLACFIDKISDYSEQLQQSRDFEQWQQLIEGLIGDFYANDLSFEAEIMLIKDCMTSLGEQLELAQYKQQISAEILFEHLRSNLNQGQSSQRFLAGKLNFCTLMPMRSIPFKVVCLLGMNDGVYPRTIAPLGFDLMVNDVQKGDRSRRDDDRYLFLEAMLSAQSQLYISYCGRSIKDNSERNPSVLVSELVDYIEQSYVLADDVELPLEQSSKNVLQHLTTEHPLAPFSRDYFKPDSRLFSYQANWQQALIATPSQQSFLDQPLADSAVLEELELVQLIRFFKLPAQYFLNQRLGVFFEEGTEDLASSEPFNPDALESYGIKNQLLESYLNDNVDIVSERLRAQGVLPHGNFSSLYLNQQSDLMAGVASAVKPYLVVNESDIEIDLTVDGLQLQGWLKQHYGAGIIRYKSGKANIKFYIACYIEHLAQCASVVVHQPKPMIMCCQDGVWQFGVLTPELALEHLTKLVAYFKQGQNKPLPLFIASGWTYINELFDPKTLELNTDEKQTFKAMSKFEQRFNGGYMMTGEGQNSYIERCFMGGLNGFSEIDQTTQADAFDLVKDILLPLRIQLEELSND